MGFVFGAGTALFALWLLIRFIPKALGLTVWLGTTGFTAAAAMLVLYVLNGAP